MWQSLEIGILVLHGACVALIAWQLAALPRWSGRRRAAFLVVTVIASTGVVMAAKTFAYAPSTWSVACALLVASLIGAMLMVPVIVLRSAMKPPSCRQSPPPGEGRRDFIVRAGTFGALGLGLATGAYGVGWGPRSYEVTEWAIPLRDLGPTLDGFRIVQVSDIHIGEFVGSSELRAMVDLVERARPDLIVLTGDLVDYDARYVPVLGRLLRRLGEIPAREGVVAVPGNHDYYTGIDEIASACERTGIPLLRNQARLIGDTATSFALLGIDYGAHASFASAVASVNEDVPRVLLAHDPAFFDRSRGHVALQLSGHTHGGQLGLLGRGPADLALRFTRGMYREQGSLLYVNRGFGTAVAPVRLGCAPEVSVFTLVSS